MIRPPLMPRFSWGEYSIASGLAAVYSPPTNTPMTNRSTTNATTEVMPHAS